MQCRIRIQGEITDTLLGMIRNEKMRIRKGLRIIIRNQI